MVIRNILFPVDFSERSRAAAPFVFALAKIHVARVTLVHAVESPPAVAGLCLTDPAALGFEPREAERKEMLSKFAESELPKIPNTLVVQTGAPADVIRRQAASTSADLVAMPTHGYGGIPRILHGSATATILHDLEIPVWTDAHTPEPSHRAHPWPRRILVAVDLKEESGKTTEFALRLGRETGAAVEIVYGAPEGVITSEPAVVRMRDLVSTTANSHSIEVEQKNSETSVAIRGGNPTKLLRDMALRKRIDLLVIGRGSIRNKIDRFGAHAYDIVRESPCPVISV